MSVDTNAAIQYVDSGPPYIGRSQFRDKDAVKAKGAKWNQLHKKWEARTCEILHSLIASSLWTPEGFSTAEAHYMMQYIDHKNTTVPNISGAEECKLRFHRRGEEDAKFDPVNDQKTLPSGRVATYVRVCNTCSVLVDSRLQFGLECDCPFGFVWKSCNTCRVPLLLGETCTKC